MRFGFHNSGLILFIYSICMLIQIPKRNQINLKEIISYLFKDFFILKHSLLFILVSIKQEKNIMAWTKISAIFEEHSNSKTVEINGSP